MLFMLIALGAGFFGLASFGSTGDSPVVRARTTSVVRRQRWCSPRTVERWPRGTTTYLQ